MALWCDPFAELIEELDRAVPEPEPVCGNLLPVADLQALIDAILYGTEAEVARLMADPRYQRWFAQMEECSRPRNGSNR